MLEGKFMSFLTSQLEVKSHALPQSATQQEIVVLVTELREAVEVLYAGSASAQGRPTRRRQNRSSTGGEGAQRGTLVQSTGDNSQISGGRR